MAKGNAKRPAAKTVPVTKTVTKKPAVSKPMKSMKSRKHAVVDPGVTTEHLVILRCALGGHKLTVID